MADELEQAPPIHIESTSKPKRNYPKLRKSPQIVAPAIPNPAIAQMEMDLAPLMGQRMAAVQQLRQWEARAKQVNGELEGARNFLADIESEVNYRLTTIAQLKGLPPPQRQFDPTPQYGAPPRFADYPQQPPSPLYNPIQPYPMSPAPMPGVSSLPANNRGLYPDANDPRLNLERDPELIANGASAEDVRAFEIKQRGL